MVILQTSILSFNRLCEAYVKGIKYTGTRIYHNRDGSSFSCRRGGGKSELLAL